MNAKIILNIQACNEMINICGLIDAVNAKPIVKQNEEL